MRHGEGGLLGSWESESHPGWRGQWVSFGFPKLGRRLKAPYTCIGDLMPLCRCWSFKPHLKPLKEKKRKQNKTKQKQEVEMEQMFPKESA